MKRRSIKLNTDLTIDYGGRRLSAESQHTIQTLITGMGEIVHLPEFMRALERAADALELWDPA